MEIVEFLQYPGVSGDVQQYLDNTICYLKKCCTCQSAICICSGRNILHRYRRNFMQLMHYFALVHDVRGEIRKNNEKYNPQIINCLIRYKMKKIYRVENIYLTTIFFKWKIKQETLDTSPWLLPHPLLRKHTHTLR